MSHTDYPKVDLVRELRLRQWARRHFVDFAVRQPSWHPIVLDEMLRRDQEQSRQPRETLETIVTT